MSKSRVSTGGNIFFIFSGNGLLPDKDRSNESGREHVTSVRHATMRLIPIQAPIRRALGNKSIGVREDARYRRRLVLHTAYCAETTIIIIIAHRYHRVSTRTPMRSTAECSEVMRRRTEC